MPRKTEIPCIVVGSRKLTLYEAAAAIEHAEAFIRLVASQEPERFGQAASEWMKKYSSENAFPESGGYDNNVDFDALERKVGLK